MNTTVADDAVRKYEEKGIITVEETYHSSESDDDCDYPAISNILSKKSSSDYISLEDQIEKAREEELARLREERKLSRSSASSRSPSSSLASLAGDPMLQV